MIADADLLKRLALRAPADRTEIADGPLSGVKPRRRIADLAVETMIARLRLSPGFPAARTKRYGDAEIAEVREAVRAKSPSA